MNKHGLNDDQLQIIRDILTKSTSGIKKVCLFGSRAGGNHKKYSDIDLVIYGDIDEADSDRLWTCFFESLLPYKVDIIVYRHIKHPLLKEEIDKYGKLLFTGEELYKAVQV